MNNAPFSVTIFKRTVILLQCVFLFFSCSTDEGKGVKGRLPVNTIESTSPAIDPSTLPKEQQEFFGNLSPKLQNAFASYTAAQREWVIKLSRQYSPHEALWLAAAYSVAQQEPEQQKLFKKLNVKMKIRFLSLDNSPSEHAVKLSEDLSPDEAVEEATKYEIIAFPDDQKKFIEKLSPNIKTLYLSMTEASQLKAFKKAEKGKLDATVIEISEEDIKRLPKVEQEFISNFSQEDKLLYLALTPEARMLAIKLTKKLDLNLAVQYAASIQ